ncbi:hypothetical protein ACH427_15350 [Streptomyces sp. NPDC020379]|uniref:hypothetical protein n=1 Tax=Streptomyces sp. NPDC020379 TaxID=3365071 RepID=UPI00379F765E
MSKKMLTQSAALLDVFGMAVTGCGSSSASKDAAPDTPSAPADRPTPDVGNDRDTLKIKSTNLLMRNTSFHASGTTTTLGGGSLEMWSDPGQGLRLKATSSKSGQSGEMFCKEGATYTSAPLFADSLRQSGQNITLPPALTDVYVLGTPGQQGCSSFYAIAETAQRAPDQDGSVNGTKTHAVVAAAGPTSDVYQIAAEDKSYLLQLRSTRDGRTSTTTYDSFGDTFSITMPSDDKTMSMNEFRRRVTG